MEDANSPGALERTFGNILDTFRAVEVAKRSNPKLVQGIEQTQTPLNRNLDAPLVPGTGSASLPTALNSNLLLGAGAALLFGVVLLKFIKKR